MIATQSEGILSFSLEAALLTPSIRLLKNKKSITGISGDGFFLKILRLKGLHSLVKVLQ
ncbi:hypothetical protein [Enterococcus timonensis]|uniref:hypothetical protein n=1 Tax=Enterococcus timonensis TaxID=1852364 RepID=UPI00131A08A5|nr:hypothetical protein [Enterococcus timonensis]